jgi:hypothetical protein
MAKRFKNRSLPSLLQSEFVVDGDLDILLRSQVPFRHLDGRVPEQELDLLEIAATLAAQLDVSLSELFGTVFQNYLAYYRRPP